MKMGNSRECEKGNAGISVCSDIRCAAFHSLADGLGLAPGAAHNAAEASAARDSWAGVAWIAHVKAVDEACLA